MSKPVRIGVLTPSSNTALEPLTCRMLAGLPEVTAHFARFRVTEIALHPGALAQFDDSRILAAAEMLADARVDVIVWSGTSSGWLGFEADRMLCHAIQQRTGIPAATSVLAVNDVLAMTGCATIGLVTPYTDDVQRRIVATYAAAGIACPAERHRGISVNHDFATIAPETLHAMAREVASELTARPAAIVTFCTNLWAAQLVPVLEQETGLPVYDTVATAVWQALRIAGVDPTRIKGWGRLFDIGG